ncbi:MAG: glycosyltransferase family 2 protein [Desulfuromonadales bacterium]
MSPRVSIVIVTWNKWVDVLNLLDSLYVICCASTNIIVVDNASTDGTAEAIRQHPLSVILIENSENLGGTGGFNTGILYALDNFEQDFIWLLDNDAQVDPKALTALLSVMTDDVSIGIAGSCILNPAQQSQVVEAGAFVDLKSLSWKPHLRYEPYPSGSQLTQIDVDYVPACSALVRREVFMSIGILDERYFLHWDDVDFCYRSRHAGYRVVTALKSKVFHGAEKGYSPTGLYFDVRNSLLFAGKHLTGFARWSATFRVCVRGQSAAVFFRLLGESQFEWCLTTAFDDFVHQRFGRAPRLSDASIPTCGVDGGVPAAALGFCRKILVFGTGSQSEIESALAAIVKAAPSATVDLAIAAERAGAYRSHLWIRKFVSFSLSGDSPVRQLKTSLNILLTGYDCAVSAGSGFIVPHAFLVRKNYCFDGATERLMVSRVSLTKIWLLPLALCCGAMLALKILWQARQNLTSEKHPNA